MKPSIDMPDDLTRAPYEIQREFVKAHNRATVVGNKDPMKWARDRIVSVFGTSSVVDGEKE